MLRKRNSRKLTFPHGAVKIYTLTPQRNKMDQRKRDETKICKKDRMESKKWERSVDRLSMTHRAQTISTSQLCIQAHVMHPSLPPSGWLAIHLPILPQWISMVASRLASINIRLISPSSGVPSSLWMLQSLWWIESTELQSFHLLLRWKHFHMQQQTPQVSNCSWW